MSEIIKERPGKVMPHQRHYQVGNIVRIRKEPPKARSSGFLLGSLHVIKRPPEGSINSASAIWLQDKQRQLRSLQFMYWEWTGKVERVTRTRTK